MLPLLDLMSIPRLGLVEPPQRLLVAPLIVLFLAVLLAPQGMSRAAHMIARMTSGLKSVSKAILLVSPVIDHALYAVL